MEDDGTEGSEDPWGGASSDGAFAAFARAFSSGNAVLVARHLPGGPLPNPNALTVSSTTASATGKAGGLDESARLDKDKLVAVLTRRLLDRSSFKYVAQKERELVGAGERLASAWRSNQEARDARLRLERELDQVSATELFRAEHYFPWYFRVYLFLCVYCVGSFVRWSGPTENG